MASEPWSMVDAALGMALALFILVTPVAVLVFARHSYAVDDRQVVIYRHLLGVIPFGTPPVRLDEIGSVEVVRRGWVPPGVLCYGSMYAPLAVLIRLKQPRWLVFSRVILTPDDPEGFADLIVRRSGAVETRPTPGVRTALDRAPRLAADALAALSGLGSLALLAVLATHVQRRGDWSRVIALSGMWGEWEESGGGGGVVGVVAPVASQSLLEALKEVPDPRSRHGRRYELVSLLGMAVCAMACGARSVSAIAQWGREHFPLLQETLGLTRERAPDPVTVHRVFRRLQASAFEAVLSRWFCAQGLAPGEGIAIDGKGLRGLHGEQVPGVHLVAAYAHQRGVVLDQQAVSGTGKELEAARKILKRLRLRGQVVTGDALLAHRDVCRDIVKRGGTISSA